MMSARLMPTARNSTRTSSGPGSGVAISPSCRAEASPGCSTIHARIQILRNGGMRLVTSVRCATQIQTNHTDNDQADADDSQPGQYLAEREHADNRDKDDPQSGPDRVGDA